MSQRGRCFWLRTLTAPPASRPQASSLRIRTLLDQVLMQQEELRSGVIADSHRARGVQADRAGRGLVRTAAGARELRH